METKDAILELRRYLNLSQNEFAEKLLVTRQAVSRWENGDTIPNTDTLKHIAKTFDVSVDYLLGLGRSIAQCQSCGTILIKNSDKGTQIDGCQSEKYCAVCYQQGRFLQDFTIEELIEILVLHLDRWNQENGVNLTVQEARIELQKLLTTLKRRKAKDSEEGNQSVTSLK